MMEMKNSTITLVEKTDSKFVVPIVYNKYYMLATNIICLFGGDSK